MKHRWGGNFTSFLELKFTPLEFETKMTKQTMSGWSLLKFTPLEFETTYATTYHIFGGKLKFTPLEFETQIPSKHNRHKRH